MDWAHSSQRTMQTHCSVPPADSAVEALVLHRPVNASDPLISGLDRQVLNIYRRIERFNVLYNTQPLCSVDNPHHASLPVQ
jgi:hypothetical protein